MLALLKEEKRLGGLLSNYPGGILKKHIYNCRTNLISLFLMRLYKNERTVASLSD